jgi:hypothetical protein
VVIKRRFFLGITAGFLSFSYVPYENPVKRFQSKSGEKDVVTTLVRETCYEQGNVRQ